MGLTQYKRRQKAKFQKTLRTCGACPITLLCYMQRLTKLPNVVLCRCNTCGLLYGTLYDDKGVEKPPEVAPFKPFRCLRPVSVVGRDVQLLSGSLVREGKCPACRAKRICIVCKKPIKKWEDVGTGVTAHYRCWDWMLHKPKGT